VQFELGPADFAIWDESMRHVVEPGTFTIMAGADSVHLKTATLEVTH
jgi:beta-glucosidase